MKKLLILLFSILISLNSNGEELNTLFGITLNDNAEKYVSSNYINSNISKNSETLEEFNKVLEPDIKALGNLRARIRMNVLYYYANLKNLTVLGSSDKSEYNIGYFTKFGDGAADTLPIVSLYKTQVREMAKNLGIDQNIISKKSSPHLWPNHEAEYEIGAEYEQIDTILYCILEKKLSVENTISESEISENIVRKIFQLYDNSVHKRVLAEEL
jgi:NAD+ synthase